MIEIKPVGDFFQNDSEGYVINPASADKITHPWDKLIDAIKRSYIEHLGDRIHSIYVRGSVAQGNAIEGFSDIDTFALVHHSEKENYQWQEAPWTEKVHAEVSKIAGFPVPKIELMLTTYTEDFTARNPGLGMVIKTQSACIYGNDLSPNIKRYKPGKEMMIECWHLKNEIQNFTQLPADIDDAQLVKKWRSLMKCIIRSGFELVMEREGKCTTSLYHCCESFSKYYPERKEYMYMALSTYLNPITDKRLLMRFIDTFAVWMVLELLQRSAARDAQDAMNSNN